MSEASRKTIFKDRKLTEHEVAILMEGIIRSMSSAAMSRLAECIDIHTGYNVLNSDWWDASREAFIDYTLMPAIIGAMERAHPSRVLTRCKNLIQSKARAMELEYEQ